MPSSLTGTRTRAGSIRERRVRGFGRVILTCVASGGHDRSFKRENRLPAGTGLSRITAENPVGRRPIRPRRPGQDLLPSPADAEPAESGASRPLAGALPAATFPPAARPRARPGGGHVDRLELGSAH